MESIAKPGSIFISFDTHSQVFEDIDCTEVESVQVKGIKEEVRVFEVVLDGSNKPQQINFQTENSQCSMNISQLEVEEIDRLAEFIEGARQQINVYRKEIE